MRSLFITFLITLTTLFLFLLGEPARAQVEKKLNLYRKDVGLREALDLIFSQSVLQYSVDLNVPDVRVTLNYRDLSVQVALRLLIRQAALEVPGLTFIRDGDIFIIMVRRYQPGAEAAWAERRISLGLEKTPLREAVAELLGGSGLKPRVGKEIPEVPISLVVREVPLRSALHQIVRQVAAEVPNLTFARDGDEWHLRVHPS